MPRTELLDQSATRVELDQRSRDARRRLEYVERLLVVRPLPRQSLLRRVLNCLGPRNRVGEQIEGRPMSRARIGGRTRRGHKTAAESGGTAGRLPAAPPRIWPNCARSARIGPERSDHWCERLT